jgi:hypothetical protein
MICESRNMPREIGLGDSLGWVYPTLEFDLLRFPGIVD